MGPVTMCVGGAIMPPTYRRLGPSEILRLIPSSQVLKILMRGRYFCKHYHMPKANG